MRARILTLLVITLWAVTAPARTVVRGSALNTDGTAARGVIVRLYEGERLKAFATSGTDGGFAISVDTVALPALLRFISMKHETLEYPLEDPSRRVEVRLNPKAYELKEVVVKAPERRVKGDTIVYDVGALTKAGDRNIEDVIKKIPGIQVDERGGISYDGEPINHFYIEGLDLMGGNYAVASRNISPADISSVSVYQRHQPKRVLQGKVESKRAALNLKLRKGRMLKPLGYVSAGAGGGEDMLWNGKLYGMFVAPSSQTIVSASGNNSGETSGGLPTRRSPYDPFGNTPFGAPSVNKDRYIANRTAYATVNHLARLRPDLTLKVNADYGNSRECFEGLTSTDYLSPDSRDLSYSESADNRIRRNTVNAAVKVENNGSRLYFSDEAAFRGAFGRNRYLVVSDADRTQRQRSDAYYFSNTLRTIIRSGERMYEVESDTWFDNRPLLTMRATDRATGETTVRQDVSASTFHNRERTAFSRELGERSTLGAALEFEADRDAFRSYGLALPDAESRNDLSGHRIVSTVSPWYKLRWRGMTWTTTVPVRLYNLKYGDILDGGVYRHDRVYVDLRSALTYKCRQASFWEVSAGHTNRIGDMTDFIDNPVYTTFRNSRTMGTGSLRRGRDDKVQADYSYKNFTDGFYLNAMASYSRTESNMLSVYNAGASGTSTSFKDIRSKGTTTNLLLNMTKQMRRWHTTFNVSANMLMSDRESMRSGVRMDVRSTAWIFTGKIDTYQFGDILTASARGSYSLQRQTFGDAIPSNSFNDLSLNLHLGVYPVRKLEIYGSASYSKVKIGEDNYKENVFVDVGVRWSSRRVELELAARNLTDMRRYEYTYYHTLDVTRNSYSLRPREFLLTLKYSF